MWRVGHYFWKVIKHEDALLKGTFYTLLLFDGDPQTATQTEAWKDFKREEKELGIKKKERQITFYDMLRTHYHKVLFIEQIIRHL